MSDDRHYDVIIIGTGAGGGTLAHRLAPSGKRVLLLERGGYLPRERDNWDSTAVFVHGKYRAPEFWYDAHGDEFPPEVNYYVGGNTKFYGAALFRLRPEDFGELRHHGGVSPAWPIDYDRPRAVLHRGRAPLPSSTAGTARTRPRGRRARSTRYPPVAARAADPAAERRPGEAGSAPVPPADRRQPHPGRARPGHPRQHLHPLRPGRRVPVPAERQVRRPGDLRRPGAAHDNVSLVTERPRARDWRPTRPAARSPPSSPSSTTGRRRASPPTSSSSPAAR